MTTTAPASDLDTLMERIDKINSKAPDDLTSDDIDTLIFYHRRNRERKASGGKPLLPTVDISKVVAQLVSKAEESAPPVKAIRRR